jgi:hypothetical protein
MSVMLVLLGAVSKDMQAQSRAEIQRLERGRSLNPVITGLVPVIPFRMAHAHLSGMAGTSPAMTIIKQT